MKIHNRFLSLTALATVMAVTPMAAFAQFDTGPTPPAAWKQFKLNPKTKVSLNFQNSGVDMILSFFMKSSGITIVKDPSLKDPLTVTSARPVTLSDAFNILNEVLKLKGYSMEKSGNLLVIRQQSQKPQTAFQFPTGDQGNRSKTELQVYPIKYANASAVATLINEVFSATPGQPAQPQFNFGRGGPNRFQIQAGGAAGAQQDQTVKASSDDYSNTVIVNATADMQTQVKSIIDQIDKQTDTPTRTKVYALKYADAQNISSVVQNVLTTNAPTGRGGAGTQNVSPQARFQQILRFGGQTQAGIGQVAVDERSNSLVVSATDDNLKIVDKVIEELDKPVQVQDSTFVVSLDNAKADTVATLFQEAFGTRQGVSGGGFNANSTQNGRNTIQTRSQGTTNTGLTGGARPGGVNLNGAGDQIASTSPDGQALQLALQDPNATSGDLLTSVGVAQGGLFRLFGGQGGQGQNNTPTTGLDQQGKVVNIRDMSGKVTVIPDINTNSLIIVAPPEFEPLIRQILDQLDKIPEQVVIETTIVEVTLDNSDQFGVEAKFAQQKIFGDPSKNSVGQTTFGLQNASPALTGFSYTLSGGDFGLFINALKTQTQFKVLSTPRIFTSNNAQAQINISQSLPYISSQTQNSLGNYTYNYQFQDVGIILTVTPRITSNGFVSLDIDQSADDLQGYTSYNAPIINKREANTSVSAKDGSTVVLGGIIRNQVTATTNKVPLLGDIPILGNLFKSTNHDHQRTELIIFMTPHVIRNTDDAEQLKNDTVKELSPEIQNTVKSQFAKPGGTDYKPAQDTKNGPKSENNSQGTKG